MGPAALAAQSKKQVIYDLYSVHCYDYKDAAWLNEPDGVFCARSVGQNWLVYSHS